MSVRHSNNIAAIINFKVFIELYSVFAFAWIPHIEFICCSGKKIVLNLNGIHVVETANNGASTVKNEWK